jgi:hypothetical protein
MILESNNGRGVLDGKAEGVLVGQGILSSISSQSGLMVKIASGSADAPILAAIKALVTTLESLSVTSNIPTDRAQDISKMAAAKDGAKSMDTTIKVASTSIKDSHYFMDVSLDPIRKADKSLVMVSYLLREGYLGRYMIKRCYYYLPEHQSDAEETYAELVRKSEGVKRRYLQGDARSYDVLPQVKAFLDGVKGDFEFREEDVIGTTVSRGEGYHRMEGPTYAKPPYSNVP